MGAKTLYWGHQLAHSWGVYFNPTLGLLTMYALYQGATYPPLGCHNYPSFGSVLITHVAFRGYYLYPSLQSTMGVSPFAPGPGVVESDPHLNSTTSMQTLIYQILIVETIEAAHNNVNLKPYTFSNLKQKY